MARSRREIELSISLEDPVRARAYIQSFDWGPVDPPKFVYANLDHVIYLNNMTDYEAVIAAKTLLFDIQIPTEMREKQLVQWEH